MKTNIKFIAFLLSVLMTLSPFAVFALGEESIDVSSENSEQVVVPSEEASAEVPSETSETSSDTSETPSVESEVPSEEPSVEPEVSSEEPSVEPEVSSEEPSVEPETPSEEPSVEPEAPSEESSEEISEESTEVSSEESTEESSEEVSEEPAPTTYTINVTVEGGAENAIIKINETEINGNFVDSVANVKIDVSAKEGYEVKSVTFDGNTLPQSGNTFGNMFYNLENGKEYALSVVVKKLPVPAKLDIDTTGVTGYSVFVNGSEIDRSTYQFMTGDTVKVQFKTDVEFEPKKATLFLGSSIVEMTSDSYEFVIEADTEIKFLYGVVPVTFILVGPGKYTISKEVEAVENNELAPKEVVRYLEKGGHYSFTVVPGEGYEIVGIAEISEPQRHLEDGIYYFYANGPITVKTVMRAATTTPEKQNCKVNVFVGAGGTVTAGTSNILGNTGTDVSVKIGGELKFDIKPDEGYELDAVLVKNEPVEVVENTYTLSNVTEDVSVQIRFKKIEEETDFDTVTAEDIDWFANPVVVDVSGEKAVSKEVFQKIETLTGKKYVEFRHENGTVYVPYGGKTVGDAEYTNFEIVALSGGEFYNTLEKVIADSGKKDVAYKIYTVSIDRELPEGTLISYNIGEEFNASNVAMYLFDGEKAGFYLKETALEALLVGNGATGKFAFANDDKTVVLAKSEFSDFKVTTAVTKHGGMITPSGETAVKLNDSFLYQITAQNGYVIDRVLLDGEPVEGANGRDKFEAKLENISADHTVEVEFVLIEEPIANVENEEGKAGKVAAILAVVFVALAGAATLFIVRWRQDKKK